jgi:predicted ATPase
VADALGFIFYEGVEPQQQLLDYLRDRQLLLVMDNYEHLSDGAGLVSDVLCSAPEVKVLATSRARLNVQGEQLFHLSGMEFPDWETPEDAARYSAVQLFLQSARRARAGFELTSDDLTYLTRICRLVGGMPLALVLAAAWAEMLTPEEIAAEIGRSMELLETEVQDTPSRQRSIRAVFDHTWCQLTDRERQVFQGLSVFRGGFTREAAQAVTGATLRDLMSLVNKSLLTRDSAGRYDAHELLRQYGSDRLDRAPTRGGAVRDRHCAYFVSALQRWDADRISDREYAALAEMDVDIENVRSAWNWAVERGQVERLDHGLDALLWYYIVRARYQEGEAASKNVANGLATIGSPIAQRVWGFWRSGVCVLRSWEA